MAPGSIKELSGLVHVAYGAVELGLLLGQKTIVIMTTSLFFILFNAFIGYKTKTKWKKKIFALFPMCMTLIFHEYIYI